jgi:hypothetical protein
MASMTRVFRSATRSFLLSAVALCLLLSAAACPEEAQQRAGGKQVGAIDCESNTMVPPGFARVHIALRRGKDGTGKTAEDARDGSTAEKFDRILRCYSEGCGDPAAPHKTLKKTDNLIVCLGPGTFQTDGTYDFVINIPHASARGFTLGKGWKIHGSGADKTTVRLAAYLPAKTVPNAQNPPASTGTGLVFGTNSDAASGIEISDLTIDANYPALKAQATREGIKALNLEAIHLRSDAGHNWIHDIRVLHTSGEIGLMNIRWETFPVWIYSAKPGSSPQDNNGNVIERVTMSEYGGGACTAIAVANALAEVRNNKVEGYQIAYGGWVLGPVRFHDNIAIGTEYGFNIDSLANRGVIIERNLIVGPRKYGIVIGGGGTYDNFSIKDNTIQIEQTGVIGFVFRGNVTNSLIQANNILWRGKSSLGAMLFGATAIRNYSSDQSGPNRNNSYQGNKISANLKITFDRPSRASDNCFHENRDESGGLLEGVSNSKNACVVLTGSAAQ